MTFLFLKIYLEIIFLCVDVYELLKERGLAQFGYAESKHKAILAFDWLEVSYSHCIFHCGTMHFLLLGKYLEKFFFYVDVYKFWICTILINWIKHSKIIGF